MLQALYDSGWTKTSTERGWHNDDCREVWTIVSKWHPTSLTLYVHLFSVSDEYFDNPVSRIIVALHKAEHFRWDYHFNQPMDLGDTVIAYAADWTKATFELAAIELCNDLNVFRNTQT